VVIFIFSVDIENINNIQIIKLAGELNHSALTELYNRLDELSSGGHLLLILDNIIDIDVATKLFNFISALQLKLAKRNCTLLVSCKKENLLFKILEFMVNEFSAFPLFHNKDNALRVLSEIKEDQKILPILYNNT